MDNQNNNQPLPPVPQSTPQDPVVPVASTPAKISAQEGFKIRMQEIKQKLGLGDPNKMKKVLIIVGAVLGILVILSVGYSLLPKQVAPPLATLTPTPASSLSPGVPSEFADDPEVLRIMDAINAFKQKEENTTLREDDLRVPVVDWNVSF